MSEEEIIKTLQDLIEAKFSIKEIRTMNLLNENDEMPYVLTIFERHTIQDLLDLYKELKDKNASLQKEIKLMKSININDNYISKDKILDILGYKEDDEQRKNMTTEKILSLIETIFEECDRLEDIEDRKVQVEIQNIERRRDKEWEDKIKDKIKILEKLLTETKNEKAKENLETKIITLKELLEE